MINYLLSIIYDGCQGVCNKKMIYDFFQNFTLNENGLTTFIGINFPRTGNLLLLSILLSKS